MIPTCFERIAIGSYARARGGARETEGRVAKLAQGERRSWATSPVSNRKQILVADDDADLLYVTCVVLESMGLETVACASPTRALDKFRERPTFDLLLTDLQMPEMSGLELAERVTMIQPALPVLIMSGSILSSDAQRTIDSQGWRFLPKPFPIPELVTQVRELTTSRPTVPLR